MKSQNNWFGIQIIKIRNENRNQTFKVQKVTNFKMTHEPFFIFDVVNSAS